MRRFLATCALAALAATTPAVCDEAPPAASAPIPEAAPVADAAQTVPDDATLEKEGAVIGDIEVRAHDIFDPEQPGENNAIFRAANKLHIDTRRSVIRKQLVFDSGDPYSRRRLEESERALRTNGYLYDAKIRPVRYENGRVDVTVETRDLWTLRLGVGVGRGGGANAVRFGLQDQNFLGLGKELTVRRVSNVDRTETLYRYRDPNVLGRHGLFTAAYSANSDGMTSELSGERPFYSLDSRWAAGAGMATSDRVDAVYHAGEVTSRYRREASTFGIHGGFSRGLQGDRTTRLLFGFTRSEERFSAVPGEAVPLDFPQDKLVAYPWVGFEQVQDQFVKVTDLDKLQRTEDHNLGRELRGRIGYSSTAFGADRDQWIYDASYSQGFNPGNGAMLVVDGGVAGRYGTAVENLVVGGGFRFDARNFGRQIFHVDFHGNFGSNLDPENRFLLGGDNGLRGYPLRYVEGDRRVLLTVEQRLYSDWHVLKLLYVGGAVFYDAGLAWDGDDPVTANRPLLQDAGIGLRLSSSRAAHGGMLKIDLAFPLNAPPGAPSHQVVVSTGATF